jgi:hypothetical protein
MNFKEIYNKLPATWEQLTLKDYLKLSPVLNDDEPEPIDEDIFTIKMLSDMDKNIQVLSLLTDVSIEAIEALTMGELIRLTQRVEFLSTPPKETKTTIKYKQYNELSYGDWTTFQKLNLDFSEASILSSAVANLPLMLSVFALDKSHNEVFFLNQSLPEVLAGFFIVNKSLRKYIRSLERSLLKSQFKTYLNAIPKVITHYWKNRKASKTASTIDGTIG